MNVGNIKCFLVLMLVICSVTVIALSFAGVLTWSWFVISAYLSFHAMMFYHLVGD